MYRVTTMYRSQVLVSLSTLRDFRTLSDVHRAALELHGEPDHRPKRSRPRSSHVEKSRSIRHGADDAPVSGAPMGKVVKLPPAEMPPHHHSLHGEEKTQTQAAVVVHVLGSI